MKKIVLIVFGVFLSFYIHSQNRALSYAVPFLGVNSNQTVVSSGYIDVVSSSAETEVGLFGNPALLSLKNSIGGSLSGLSYPGVQNNHN